MKNECIKPPPNIFSWKDFCMFSLFHFFVLSLGSSIIKESLVNFSRSSCIVSGRCSNLSSFDFVKKYVLSCDASVGAMWLRV